MSPRVVKNSTHQPQRANLSWLDFHRTGQINDVKIIVTIFNAFEAVSECLLSLERTTSPDVEVVLIDDCSTDTRIRDLLSTYANRSRFRIVRNSENIGYTRSINKGIELCGRSDVVLLNSDTVVTDRWLENLRYCAYAHSKVATVTPLSDNAGAFSAPEIGVLNPVPAHLDGSSYARLITGAAKDVCCRCRQAMVFACISVVLPLMSWGYLMSSNIPGVMAKKTISACAHFARVGRISFVIKSMSSIRGQRASVGKNSLNGSRSLTT